MLTLYPYENLGHANHGWLNARHHFSFGHYYNPNRMGFGTLRVINDDRIAAGRGFDIHPHDNMEIITYVRSGAITHHDSEGNEGRTEAGDVQVMSAGSGIMHSEHNKEFEDTTLYQIWIEPKERNIKPRWGSAVFPKDSVKDQLSLLVSGDGDAPLTINQDARIYAGRLQAGTTLTQPITHQAYILISEGEVELDGQLAKQGDGVEITSQNEVVLHAITDSEVLVLDVPEK